MQQVILPETITTINDNAFKDCNLLSSINIPEITESIGSYAFANCTSLEQITIPESVQLMKSYAFYKSGLKNITLEHTDWDISSMPKLISRDYMPNYPRDTTRAQEYNGKFDFTKSYMVAMAIKDDYEYRHAYSYKTVSGTETRYRNYNLKLYTSDWIKK